MIVDTSVLLSIFFKEEHAEWAFNQLDQNKALLQMSTVNLTEVLILIQDRLPAVLDEIHQEIFSGKIGFASVTASQARIAAVARLKFPRLNFGDCFAYALAKSEGSSIITLDKDFLKTDLDVVSPY